MIILEINELRNTYEIILIELSFCWKAKLQSYSFPKAICLQLCNIMFPPWSLLYQPPGKERIYKVRLGKIDIYAFKKKAPSEAINTKLLKTIKFPTIFMPKLQLFRDKGLTLRSSQATYIRLLHRRRKVPWVYHWDFEVYIELKNKIDESLCWSSI